MRLWMLDGLQTAAHARIEDASRPVTDLVLLIAAGASLGAIGVALIKAGHAHGLGKAAIVVVAVVSVAGAWAVVQTIYALRYARIYFSENGGIDFNENEVPDYRDFAYLAATIGMTYQVSDTAVSSKTIRRTVIRHSLLSYALGAVVLAVAINVVAGLLNH
jgi:uncharacterized membrane protein